MQTTKMDSTNVSLIFAEILKKVEAERAETRVRISVLLRCAGITVGYIADAEGINLYTP